MHQAIVEQEVQSPINGRRRSATAILLAQYCKNVLGTQRLVALPHQLKHPSTQGGQAQALLRTQGIGLGQGAMDTMRMVVGTAGKRCYRHGRRRLLRETLLCYLFQPS